MIVVKDSHADQQYTDQNVLLFAVDLFNFVMDIEVSKYKILTTIRLMIKQNFKIWF